jgi:hypothetical protein
MSAVMSSSKSPSKLAWEEKQMVLRVEGVWIRTGIIVEGGRV